MRESIRLGTVFGVRVGLNPSVFVIVAILVVGLGLGRFPASYPDHGWAAYLLAAVATAVLFLASLLAHEISHAVVARRHGIEVEGLTLWLLGGVAQLKGEPRTPRADFRIAVVGPLTSLVLGVLAAGLAAALDLAGAPALVVGMFVWLAAINVVLAAFNLVPAAPLDGGRVLRAALWAWRGDRVRAAVVAARAGRVFGYVLMIVGAVDILVVPGFSGLWLMLVGLFLVNVASAEEQHTQVAETLRGIQVGDVMTPDPTAADPDEPVDRFVREGAWADRHSTYPLLDSDGRLLGLATINRIRALPRERRATTTLREIACPAGEVPVSRADESLVDLLPRLRGCGDGRAVVVDDQRRVVGIVSPSDISRAIQMRDLHAFDPYQGPRGADVTSVGPADRRD